MPTRDYNHLTYEQRCQIETLNGILPQNEIAKKIGVHPATISRELSRNSGVHGCYYFKIADKLTNGRRRLASRRPRKLHDADLQYIEARLRERWSPEQIAGYCKVNSIMSISHESIYKFIWKDKKGGGTLHTCLRHRGKKYHKRGAKTAGRGLIPNRVGIEDRPQIVETKSRKGDFEGDTIIGAAQRGIIMSHVDRHSKYTKLTLLPDRTVKSILIGIKQSLESLKDGLHTITYDNGMEFAGHAEISKLLGVECFFAKPYHSWERGLNEHTNGLVRQYFPKGTFFDTLTPEMVQAVEDALNFRPRKSLGYRTPHEVYFSDA